MIKKLFVFFLVFISISAACSSSEEVGKVREVIMRYNQLLVEGYKKMDMNPLQEVATIEQATRLYHHMSALGEGDIRMLSQLKRIEFLEFKFPKKTEAVVRTKEIWDFSHTNINTDEKVYEQKDFIYTLVYKLVKESNRWLVSEVISESDKRKE